MKNAFHVPRFLSSKVLKKMRFWLIMIFDTIVHAGKGDIRRVEWLAKRFASNWAFYQKKITNSDYYYYLLCSISTRSLTCRKILIFVKIWYLILTENALNPIGQNSEWKLTIPDFQIWFKDMTQIQIDAFNNISFKL